ncbi:hypothetical protein CEXT_44471 [Caerostris extrusa]|uniref:Uncharacterized protein n=1 Tax=Caerostris extrusa TaxID=172846 RepID=A0AAV4WJ66_CAEEX|nr:hypothetical protein CEXT_44471 [Caerostris extrusa]
MYANEGITLPSWRETLNVLRLEKTKVGHAGGSRGVVAAPGGRTGRAKAPGAEVPASLARPDPELSAALSYGGTFPSFAKYRVFDPFKYDFFSPVVLNDRQGKWIVV